MAKRTTVSKNITSTKVRKFKALEFLDGTGFYIDEQGALIFTGDMSMDVSDRSAGDWNKDQCVASPIITTEHDNQGEVISEHEDESELEDLFLFLGDHLGYDIKG